MTPTQTFIVSALGGLLGVLGLGLFMTLALGLYCLICRLYDWRQDRRQRRARRQAAADLAACRAITALGTVPEPRRPKN
ncbi:hypothetical protein AB0907_24205 [Streptomyces sp. NPDC006975]|uniref:hypothetical protein n=1 Tax=Streptomyces sp. NPDC006975 TaxID=3154310 RepID=UPI003451B286